MILTVAKRIQRRVAPNMDIWELINSGFLGLEEARLTYAPIKPFVVYAEYRVKGAMLDAVARQNPFGNSPRWLRRQAVDLDDCGLVAGSPAEELVARYEKIAAIRRQMRFIRRRERKIFDLYFFQGFTQKQIATRFKISEPRVNVIIKAARKIIQERTIYVKESSL